MNVDNHQSKSRPRPQAVPEVVSLSVRRHAGVTSDSDIRKPFAAGQGVTASADAVHPAGKSAANNPQVIVEVAPQKPPVAASANRGKQIIVEMSPDVTSIHAERSARGRSIGSQTVIVEVSPDISAISALPNRTDRERVAPKLNAGRRAVSGQVIVEVSPDVPSTSVRNAINPESASDLKPLISKARQA